MKIVKNILSTIIDISITFSITLILNRIFWNVFVASHISFPIITLLYYIVCYAISRKQTIGKYFTSIQILSKDEKPLSFRVVIIRELLLKFGIGIVFAICITGVFLRYCFQISLSFLQTYHILIFILILNFVILIPFYILRKENWWNTLAGTKVVYSYISKKKKRNIYLFLIMFFCAVYLLLLVRNNIDNPGAKQIMGFKTPVKFVEYPNNRNVEKYNQYIKENVFQDPKEYILGLFEKYDIVILCESYHIEDTQWDMIYDIVSDQRFIKKSGHLFTEYGAKKDQYKVNNYFDSIYINDTFLSKAAARLMNYHSGNFFFFMKKLYYLNRTLPDSLKIREHFTDILNWKYLHHSYDTEYDISDRDSLMAQVIIDWYQINRKKCLVVTNYRHAFMLNSEAQSLHPNVHRFEKNEAQYIYNIFPEKTTNVLIYGHGYDGLLFYLPIQKGKWKTSLRNIGYPPVGFDIKDTPFGNDKFDFYPSSKRHKHIKYQDVFNGFVFYKPDEEFRASLPLFEKYAAELEYKELLINSKYIDTTAVKAHLSEYLDFPDNKSQNWLFVYVNFYHYFDIFLFFLLFVLTFIASTIILLRNKNNS